MKTYFLALIIQAVVFQLFSQDLTPVSTDVSQNQHYNWFNRNPKTDKTMGVGTDEAYRSLLRNKKSIPVVVAVIDGGVDINHEEFKGKIWVNEKEIPGNGIDDDKNGYVDDVNGWNFLGNIVDETIELTRIFKVYEAKYAGKNSSDITDTADYSKYLKIKVKYVKESEKAENEYKGIQSFSEKYSEADKAISTHLGKENYTLEDVSKINTDLFLTLAKSKTMIQNLLTKGFIKSDFTDYLDYLKKKVNYHYNLQFNPRSNSGENPEVLDGKSYGNNDVIGGRADHGTSVAGVIAADRNNNLGILGIAENVKIMGIRVVPDGDERDKDIALAIRYAVDNGARVINCSFGKYYSPQKAMVDDAVKYAGEKGVLIVHAAGNEADNNDIINHYPLNRYENNQQISESWIEVGASDRKVDENLLAVFSNYGQKNVDIFAPGVNIYSCGPKNKYKISSGTSLAAPVVTGVAAVLMSYYPEYSAKQIKDILLKSGTKAARKKVYLTNSQTKKKEKIAFGKLSNSGKIANLYQALLLAEKLKK